MVVKFSRHSKRRAKLYHISESIIENLLLELNFPDGEHELVKEIYGFEYPLKIVFSVESDIITVITNYPLKKGIKK